MLIPRKSRRTKKKSRIKYFYRCSHCTVQILISNFAEKLKRIRKQNKPMTKKTTSVRRPIIRNAHAATRHPRVATHSLRVATRTARVVPQMLRVVPQALRVVLQVLRVATHNLRVVPRTLCGATQTVCGTTHRTRVATPGTWKIPCETRTNTCRTRVVVENLRELFSGLYQMYLEISVINSKKGGLYAIR